MSSLKDTLLSPWRKPQGGQSIILMDCLPIKLSTALRLSTSSLPESIIPHPVTSTRKPLTASLKKGRHHRLRGQGHHIANLSISFLSEGRKNKVPLKPYDATLDHLPKRLLLILTSEDVPPTAVRAVCAMCGEHCPAG